MMATYPARYGQSGGGGQAAGQAIGMGVGAAAGIANVIIQGANNPFEIGKKFTREFERGITNLRALESEYLRATEQHENAVAWLTHPANKLQWMRGGPAMRAAPAGSRLCPPIYQHAVRTAARGEEPAPGGHAFGDTLCKCPTHKCAFKPQVRGMVDDKKRIAKESERHMDKILNTRGLGLGRYLGTMTATTQGNLLQGRGTLQGHWSVLMSLDSLSPLYVMGGAQAPPRPPNLTTQDTLDLLYPDDIDANEGRVPIDIRGNTLNTALGLYGMGGVPAAFTLPLWAYGFTQSEVRQFGLGPNIAQVAAVQASGSTGGNLSARIAALIKSGAMATVPAAPPSAVSPATIADLQGQVAAGRRQQQITMATRIGAGAAILGVAGWAIYTLTRD